MAYSLLIRKSAQKTLKRLAVPLRLRIAEKIHQLGQNPDDGLLDIKPLSGLSGFFRMRVGDWRVIYQRDEEIKVLSIEKIASRGRAYKR